MIRMSCISAEVNKSPWRRSDSRRPLFSCKDFARSDASRVWEVDTYRSQQRNSNTSKETPLRFIYTNTVEQMCVSVSNPHTQHSLIHPSIHPSMHTHRHNTHAPPTHLHNYHHTCINTHARTTV